MVDSESIKAEALKEVQQETRRKKIDAEKVKIRERQNRSLWQRIFPYKITFKIERI